MDTIMRILMALTCHIGAEGLVQSAVLDEYGNSGNHAKVALHQVQRPIHHKVPLLNGLDCTTPQCRLQSSNSR